MRFLLLSGAIAISSAAAAQDAAPARQPLAIQSAQDGGDCKDQNAAEVIVCGTRPQKQYRIDPGVLAANRAAEALPPKPALDASTDQSCVGPDCGGGTIPLVGMALTALKAAALAAQGDDWREAFRTHPDEYSAYQQSKKKGGISIGISATGK